MGNTRGAAADRQNHVIEYGEAVAFEACSQNAPDPGLGDVAPEPGRRQKKDQQ